MKILICAFALAAIASAAAPIMMSGQTPGPMMRVDVSGSASTSIAGEVRALVGGEIQVRCTASLLPPLQEAGGSHVRPVAVSMNFLAGRTLLGHVQTLRYVSGSEPVEFEVHGLDLDFDQEPTAARRSLRASLTPRPGLSWMDVDGVDEDLVVQAARIE